jgi:SAM-dependent methyltransferase
LTYDIIRVLGEGNWLMQSNTNCRVSDSKLDTILDFGLQPLGNGFLNSDQIKDEFLYQMQIGFNSESKMVQLLNQPSPTQMFHDNYAFFSGTSSTMLSHFRTLSESILSSGYLSDQSQFIIELGCNDGIFLKNFSDLGYKHLGIEPSKNVAQESKKKGINVLEEFFSSRVAEQIIEQYGQADVFVAANVMCHIENIKDTVLGIKKLLKPKGLVIFEDPYLGSVIQKISYDQIYDEHVFLFSAHSVQYLFSLFGMELIDVEIQETHGGSMRYTLAHRDSYDVKETVISLLQKEKLQGLDRLETFYSFKLSVEKSRLKLLNLLHNLRDDKKQVYGYGATSKSTTILNYCNIGRDLISGIFDTTPSKIGKLSPGTHIPILAHSDFTKLNPQFTFLFAWNHANEIFKKEDDYLKQGGKWITHVPEVKIL